MGGFNFNPILSEIQGHLQSMSPDAQAVVTKVAGNAIAPVATSQPTAAPGMLLPHPDSTPPAPIGMGSSTPSLSMPVPAPSAPRLVTGPDRGQAMMTSGQPVKIGTTLGDTIERSRLLDQGPPVDSIYHNIANSGFGQEHPFAGKLLGGLAEVGGKIGDTLANAAPGIAREIPGTTQRHNMLLGHANAALTQDEANAQKEAQTSGEQQKGDLEEQQARAAELTPASAEEAAALGIPEGTMLNAASRAALAKQTGINKTKVQTTGMTVQGREDVAAANNLTKEKVSSLKPEQRDDRAIRLMEKPAESRTPEENAYLGAYSKWIDQTKTQPGVQRMMALAQFRPVQVLGSDGEVHYDYSGHAINSGASTPQSMNFRTALGMSKFMTSGKGGQTITAYNTANDHLELLGKAMDALQNGDVQGLNRLSNAFKQQFGSSAPTNVKAVKAMLAGELANVAKVTGATDPEIQEQKNNLDLASSPEQIKGFIETNHDLMDQKAYEMYQQYQQGEQGQPAFGKGLSGHNPTGGGPPPGAQVIKWEDVK